MCQKKKSSAPAWIAGAVLLGLADAALAALATVATVVLVTLLVLCGAGVAAFILAERRFRPGGLRSPQKAAPAGDVRSPALGAGSPAAIEGARPTALLGIVLSDDLGVRRDDAS